MRATGKTPDVRIFGWPLTFFTNFRKVPIIPVIWRHWYAVPARQPAPQKTTTISLSVLLVGGRAAPRKNMKVSWEFYSQYMGKNQSTNRIKCLTILYSTLLLVEIHTEIPWVNSDRCGKSTSSRLFSHRHHEFSTYMLIYPGVPPRFCQWQHWLSESWNRFPYPVAPQDWRWSVLASKHI